jgi:hypothetical protein
MDRIGSLGWQAGEATVSRDAGNGSEIEARYWRRIIMWQCGNGERNKDPSGFFSSQWKIIKLEINYKKETYKGLFAKRQMPPSQSDQNTRTVTTLWSRIHDFQIHEQNAHSGQLHRLNWYFLISIKFILSHWHFFSTRGVISLLCSCEYLYCCYFFFA